MKIPLLAICIGTLILGTDATAQQEKLQTRGSVSYLSGGIGVASQERLEAREKEFNLKLVFTLVEGNYLADVKVVLKNAAGKNVLEATADGPFFLARLPAGAYAISATYGGVTKTRKVKVGDRLRTEYLRWPSRPGVDVALPPSGVGAALAPRPVAQPEVVVRDRTQACQGSYYEAVWTNCVGEVTTGNGQHYIGEFRDGLYHGQGTTTNPDGEKYVGEFKGGKRHGQGTATYPDGRKYVGEWRDDEYNGQGTATLPNGEEYVGEFKRGERDGRGTATYPNGEKYVGEFKGGKRDGQGAAAYPDGRKYAGEWRNDQYNGRATATYPDGSVYVGEFRNGQYHGQGAITLPDNTKYVGEFKNGHYHGQGTATYADGFKYVGEWRNDKANGQGTATYPDGRKYVGEWTDDKVNGQGIEYGPDGSILRAGIWKNGRFIGDN